MSFGEYFNAFSSLGGNYLAQQKEAEQRKWEQDAAGLAGKQLDLYLKSQGAPVDYTQQQNGGTGALPPLGATSTPRLPTFADASGSGGDYISNLFKRESGGNPNARPSTSGAAGLGQFIPSTWNATARAHPELGLTPIMPGAPDPRKNERQMVAATQALTADNEAVLSAKGLPVTDASRYALHFLGSGAGPKLVAGALSNPGAPAASFAGAAAVAANRPVFFNKDGSLKTAGQVMSDFQRSFGGGTSRIAQTPVAVPTFGGRGPDTADASPAMQMPGVISNPPMPPQRPVQLASADPEGVTLPSPAPMQMPQPVAPVRSMQLPPGASGLNPAGAGRPMLAPPQASPQAALPSPPAPGGGKDGPSAPVGAPAPVAALQPPPTQLPQQSVVAPRPVPMAPPAAPEAPFVPGTIAAPAIGGPQQGQLPAVQGAPRMTPQQADFLRAQLANPLTRAQAIQTIQGLGTPDKWETKELGGRVVQVNSRGDVRALPGFDKPPTYQTQTGPDGNAYTFNPQTGQWTRAIEGKEKTFSDVMNPAERRAAGVPDWYQGSVQRGPDNRIYYPGAGQQGVTPAQKLQTTAEAKLAENEVQNVIDAREAGKHAGTKLQTLAILSDAWKRNGDSIYTGPGAETVLKAKQAAKNFGIDLGGVPESEIVSKVGTQLAAQTAKDLTSRPTQFDFAVMLQNNPGLMVSEAGNRALINIGQQQAKRELQLAQLASKYKYGDNWNEMVSKFEESHPIVSPMTGKPLDPNELIDPRFGPPQQQAAGGQAGQGAQLRPMDAGVMGEARAAIAAGKPAGAIIQRLREHGYDPGGL